MVIICNYLQHAHLCPQATLVRNGEAIKIIEPHKPNRPVSLQNCPWLCAHGFRFIMNHLPANICRSSNLHKFHLASKCYNLRLLFMRFRTRRRESKDWAGRWCIGGRGGSTGSWPFPEPSVSETVQAGKSGHIRGVNALHLTFDKRLDCNFYAIRHKNWIDASSLT